MFDDALEPITVTTRTRRLDGDGNPVSDEYGSPIYDTSSITRDGLFAPQGGIENTLNQDTVISQPTVYFTDQAATDVAAVADSNSAVTVRSVGYEVDGEPVQWAGGGLVLLLRRVTGAG